jgi:hypothetical protein
MDFAVRPKMEKTLAEILRLVDHGMVGARCGGSIRSLYARYLHHYGERH